MLQIAMVLLQNAVVADGSGMSTGALAFMVIAMGMVTAMLIWCFARILNTKEHFDPDGTGPAHPPVPGREDR